MISNEKRNQPNISNDKIQTHEHRIYGMKFHIHFEFEEYSN